MSLKPHKKHKGQLSVFRTGIDSLFEDFLNNRWLQPIRTLEEEMVISPKTDISETKDGFQFSLELPGIKEEDIDISLDNNTLIITAESKKEEKTKEKNYYRVERSHGSFQRSMTMPDNADIDAISASFKNGLLDVNIPKIKSTSSETKKIPINK